MSKTIQERGRPKGLLRLFLRAPIWLYRLRLGWLLGHRFLMLEHIGRRSGETRRTVLEVVDHDRRAGRYVVASAWGPVSDWYRNVRQTPQVTMWVAVERFPAIAKPMGFDQAVSALRSYAERNPRAFRALGQLMLGEVGEELDENCRRLAGAVPLVQLEKVPA
jgi:deazaflavin-dependent oxidoreductase (nitroreductase family)